MDPEALRRFVRNHQAVEEIEAQEWSNRPWSTERAWAAAMELLLFDEAINGDPFNRYDPVTDEEDEAMWQAWEKLRAGWPLAS